MKRASTPGAIEKANSLRPDFVVVCGDMVHHTGDEAEIAELFRITETLEDGIPLHWVSGNHDVGESPTSESIALYREKFGADNYSFDHADCHFTVINSSVASDPTNVPREWDRIVQFLGDDMSAAAARGRRALGSARASPAFPGTRRRGPRLLHHPSRTARRDNERTQGQRRLSRVRRPYAQEQLRARRRSTHDNHGRGRLPARRRPFGHQARDHGRIINNAPLLSDCRPAGVAALTSTLRISRHYLREGKHDLREQSPVGLRIRE